LQNCIPKKDTFTKSVFRFFEPFRSHFASKFAQKCKYDLQKIFLKKQKKNVSKKHIEFLAKKYFLLMYHFLKLSGKRARIGQKTGNWFLKYKLVLK
jgi:hypothetical protein